ncbi:MAG TPA: T9SS type A sorting domain-containing protein [Ignavibacteria bacterium]|nr:T9SS type A sorting domain-containing protein [Ignavibacteria bacterium]
MKQIFKTLILLSLLPMTFLQSPGTVMATGDNSVNLQLLVPQTGPNNSVAVEKTMTDLLSSSNATNVYGVDYMVNGTKVATLIAATTNSPTILNISKPVSDRLLNYSLETLELTMIDTKEFYIGKLVKPSIQANDILISFCVFETQTQFIIENKWTNDEYFAPQGAINVYNFQIWSSSNVNTKYLVEKVKEKLSTIKPVEFLYSTQKTPDVYIENAYYDHSGKINLNFINAGNQQNITIKIVYIDEFGESQTELMQNVWIGSGATNKIINQGVMLNANIFVTSATGFKDAVFITGGSFSPLAGANSTIQEFEHTIRTNSPIYYDNIIKLAGGARLKGILNDQLTILRSLKPGCEPMNLTAQKSLAFEVFGNGKMTIFLECIHNGNIVYTAQYITVNGNAMISLPLNIFRVGNSPVSLSDVKVIGFQLDKGINPNITNTEFKVQNIVFTDNPVSITNNSIISNTYQMSQNFPNPFNPETSIKLDIPISGKVTLKVYDVSGKHISTLIDKTMQPVNNFEVKFNGANLPSGVYFYSLQTEGKVITKKMILQK